MEQEAFDGALADYSQSIQLLVQEKVCTLPVLAKKREGLSYFFESCLEWWLLQLQGFNLRAMNANSQRFLTTGRLFHLGLTSVDSLQSLLHCPSLTPLENCIANVGTDLEGLSIACTWLFDTDIKCNHCRVLSERWQSCTTRLPLRCSFSMSQRRPWSTHMWVNLMAPIYQDSSVCLLMLSFSKYPISHTAS